MPTVSELLEYYINLLIIQYAQKDKMRGTVSALVESVLADNVAFDVRDGFDLETATGEQLDIIGKYAGIDRFYNGQVFAEKAFGFVTYANDTADTQEGFATYADSNKEGYWLTYDDVVSGSLRLEDEDYRTIIKLKIVQNNIDHSHKSIDDSLASFFGTSIRAESTGDMKMVYFVPSDLTALMQVAIDKEVLPRPMGVGLDYIVLQDEDMFGFATYSDDSATFKTGFATYADVDTKVGEMLTYSKLLEA